MMLNQEDTLVKYYALDNSNNNNITYSFTTSMKNVGITDYQRKQMKTDPVLLVDFSKLHIVPSMLKLNNKTNTNKLEVSIDVWRSVNNRPFQRWIDPTLNLCNLQYNFYTPHNDWIIEQIDEFNTLSSLKQQQQIREEWDREGYNVVFFSDFPEFEWQVPSINKHISNKVIVVGVKGTIKLDSDETYNNITMTLGHVFLIPLSESHTISTHGDTNSLWFYAFKRPHGNIAQAFDMD